MPTRMTPLVDDARTRNNRVERYYNQTLYIITCACNYIIHNNEFNFQHLSTKIDFGVLPLRGSKSW